MTTPGPETRILIADDHPVFRSGLRQVIEAEPGLTVVEEAGDGLDALSKIRAQRPQIAVLDVDMPGLNGFEVLRSMRKERLEVGVVFLTMHKDEDIFNEALNLDALGFVLKDSAVTEIVGSIRAAAAGRHYISPSISDFLVKRNRKADELAKNQPGLGTLTPAERHVVRLIAEHKTNKEIAAELFVSPRTVENHRANICQKLDLRGAHALLKFALDHKNQLA